MIPAVWDELESVLAPAFEAGEGILSRRDIYNWLMEDHAVAFSTMKDGKITSVLIVMKVRYSEYSVARIVACAGKNLRGAMKFIDALEAWALTQGCVEIEGWCRASVARLVRPLGWKPKLTIVSRDLRHKLH